MTSVTPARRVLVTGIATSAAGVAAFATAHAVLIVPIWTQAIARAPFALVAGLTMAWAYESLCGITGIETVASGVRFGAALFFTLLPPTLFENALRLAHARLDSNVEVVADLLLAAASGAMAGAMFVRQEGARRVEPLGAHPRRRLLVAFAATSAGLTTLMGGPIPVVNSTRAASLFVAFLPICVAGAVTLVLARRIWFSGDPMETA